MLATLVRERYRTVTVAALDHALGTLDDHEKLLLLYYHVDGLKLREIARLGGVAVLHLEGLWTRYEDPEPLLQELADLPADKAAARMSEIYAEPVKPDLVGHRIRQLKETGAVACGAVTPQRTEALT